MVVTIPSFSAITTPSSSIIPLLTEKPKSFILEHCKTIKDLNQVHAHLIKTRHVHNSKIAEPLLESAALLLPSMDYAVSIFNQLELPNSSSYNVIIRGLTLKQSANEAILLYRQMIEHSVQPDEFTFSSVLKACSRIKGLREGKQIHAHIAKFRSVFEREGLVENALVYMYASCGDTVLARKVFDGMLERSTITWNSMFSGYVKSEYWEEIINLFNAMLEAGEHFDEVTLISVLTACGKLRNLKLGKWINDHVEKNGLMKSSSLLTSILGMYAKCGSLDLARKVFDRILRKDVVAWSAMISGYSQANRCKDALAVFNEMQKSSNVEPNEVTMVTVVSSCATLGALETGKWIHSYVMKNNLNVSVSLGTALVDFYSKCGCIDTAVEVFENMRSKNVWSWTTLIQGLASNGHGIKALEYYNLMLRKNISPNDVMLLGVLRACSHVGLVDEGRAVFSSMSQELGIEPNIEHYGCMVDILGRVGLLEEAFDFINKMPIKPNAVIWRTLLASCRVHKNVELGEEAFKQALRLEPACSADYILLSNIYASLGRLEDALMVRNQMKEIGIKKSPGCSSIEVDGVIHEFLAEHNAHSHLQEIYATTRDMIDQIKLAGYVPVIEDGRLEGDESGREVSVSHHSEKLAIAFGLLKTPPGTTIRISKNLRICNDCHNAAKLVSTVFNREIFVRDRNRFHRFVDGSCSCNDFW